MAGDILGTLGSVKMADKGDVLSLTIVVKTGAPSTTYYYRLEFAPGCTAGLDDQPLTTDANGYATVTRSVSIPTGATAAGLVMRLGGGFTTYVSAHPTRIH
jgi:hypothetical protein